MPRLSPERLDARRRGIVQAAARCLQRNGLQGTGMRDLFRAANLSPGAVYGYFSSKEELLAAVAETTPTVVEAALARAGEAGGPAERLHRTLAACARAPAPARLQLELETAALGSPRVAAALARRRRAAADELARSLAPPGDRLPAELVELVVALGEGLARRALLAERPDLAAEAAAAGRLLAAALPWPDPLNGPGHEPKRSGGAALPP